LLNRIGFEILFCCWNLGCLILRIFLACVPASVAAASHPSAASNAQASRRLCFASVRRLRPGMRSGELLEYRYAIQGSKQTLKETEWGTVSRVELILLPGRARVEQTRGLFPFVLPKGQTQQVEDPSVPVAGHCAAFSRRDRRGPAFFRPPSPVRWVRCNRTGDPHLCSAGSSISPGQRTERNTTCHLQV
jgi:hypothetical protein